MRSARSRLARRGADAAAGALLLAALVFAAGCTKRQPAIEYMPNMAYGPRLAAQHEDPLRPGYSVERPPVEGTVPRDITPYRFAQADTTQAVGGVPAERAIISPYCIQRIVFGAPPTDDPGRRVGAGRRKVHRKCCI